MYNVFRNRWNLNMSGSYWGTSSRRGLWSSCVVSLGVAGMECPVKSLRHQRYIDVTNNQF